MRALVDSDWKTTRHGGIPWEHLTGTDRFAACVVAARDGDRRALDALVADLSPVVWHIARGVGLDVPDAEDVVQTVWLALLRHVDSIAEPRAVVGWLITTTRREAKRSRRDAAQVARLRGDTPEPLWVGNDPLWQAFHRLDARCQELLRLTVLARRQDYEVLAAILRMPAGSIGPTRSRCLAALRALYDPDPSAPIPLSAREARVGLRSGDELRQGQPLEVDFAFVVPSGAHVGLRAPSARPVPLRVLLHAEGAAVRPMTRVVELGLDRTSEPVVFEVVPGESGALRLVFRVYLVGGGQLLQEVRAELEVSEP
ncbi:DNA-directed RNA polymerase specialized sigma subunit, sigma24 family [Actinokineospora diospyrosa]|uniref:DNA-directed RNA polymerase specialized sigma subunit, sigma24 family n=1 Tax=Actinokineospora diospyrosa TaxID=103728 RepID=A0ABT1I8M6_9PSEU|nr:DNA-directed RNA polymerase specialized sigma subunit, sigma24 family [Actinokineospora diospyrosa]